MGILMEMAKEVAFTRHRDETIAAFEALALPLEKQVYFVCLNMMGNREDAQDCAQEAMLKAFKAFPRFEGRSKFSTWLYSIATNVCLDALRGRKETVSLEVMRESGWEVPDAAPEAYERLEESERRRLIKDALSELAPDYRAAMTLVDLNGLSYQVAAEALEVPLGTLKSRVSRARDTMTQILSRQPELFAASPRHKGERRETP
ncbi:MAG: RNA polymerase sigma factor [Eubacteriales bacterium]|nr:RNA polymerase sigma factor [Eubacteriales bacterium]